MTIDQSRDTTRLISDQELQQLDRLRDLEERVAQLDREVDNFRTALQSARTIGIAMGILVVTYKVPDDQAFKMLAAISMQTNRKVRDVSAELAYSGTLHGLPPSG